MLHMQSEHNTCTVYVYVTHTQSTLLYDENTMKMHGEPTRP